MEAVVDPFVQHRLAVLHARNEIQYGRAVVRCVAGPEAHGARIVRRAALRDVCRYAACVTSEDEERCGRVLRCRRCAGKIGRPCRVIKVVKPLRAGPHDLVPAPGLDLRVRIDLLSGNDLTPVVRELVAVACRRISRVQRAAELVVVKMKRRIAIGVVIRTNGNHAAGEPREVKPVVVFGFADVAGVDPFRAGGFDPLHAGVVRTRLLLHEEEAERAHFRAPALRRGERPRRRLGVHLAKDLKVVVGPCGVVCALVRLRPRRAEVLRGSDVQRERERRLKAVRAQRRRDRD